jgi:signal transduction histidine kinase
VAAGKDLIAIPWANVFNQQAIRMEMSDTGKSFPADKMLLEKNPKRLGLIGMRERLEMIGGSLAILSTPGKGTLVRTEIPFTQSPKPNETT